MQLVTLLSDRVCQTEISGLLGSELNMAGHHIGTKHSLGGIGIQYGGDLQRLQQGFVISEQHSEIAAHIHFPAESARMKD